LVIALLLAGLASCGGGAEATEVRTFAPWAPGGQLNSDVERGVEVSGTCDGVSSSLQRSDAFRCFFDAPAADGSTIGDPCFAGGDGQVACLAEPGGEATVVDLTAPLPGDGAGDTNPQEGPPWAMTLDSGEECGYVDGATASVGGERLNYSCDDGLMVYGEPDRSEAVWTVTVGREGSSTLSTARVELAWF
jgi:hypothetical protein